MPALKSAVRNGFSIIRNTNPAFSGVNGQIEHIGGMGTKSGQKVDEPTSLRVAAVWIACTVLADEAASLKMKIIKRGDNTREPQRPPKLRALWGAPNPDQTRYSCDVAEVMSLALWGASYTMLNWTRARELDARWTIDPSGVSLERLDDMGLKLKCPKGELLNRPGELPQFQFTPRYTLPGQLTPVSPVRMAAELAGLSLAYEETAARLMGRGMNPSAVVTADDVVKEEQAQQLSTRLERLYGSAAGAGKIAVLGGKGMKIERMAMSAVDAQMIEHEDRVFNALMAMWRVPPTVAGMVDKPSTWGTGVAEFSRGLERFTLRPLVELRQESNERWIASHVDPDLQVRYPFDSLLSASPRDRVEIQARRLQNGMTSTERILAQDDEPPFGDDETVYSPLAMAQEEDRRLARIAQQAETYSSLIKAGATPEAAAEVSGFDPSLLKHTGAPPVTVQPVDDGEGA